MALNWNATEEEGHTIAEIVKRAQKLVPDIQIDPMCLGMDIMATHLNGCPLKLEELLKADDGNFGHDVFGIRKHIDRETGQLLDCFVPRFAKQQ